MPDSSTMTLSEMMEEVAILEQAEAIKNGPASTPEPGTDDFTSAMGLIPADEIKAKGGIADISDPTRLLTIYVTKTGEPREVPAWTLVGRNSILRRKNEDGTRVYSDKQNPAFHAGAVPCMLHRSHPERETFRGFGLLVDCPASKLASYYDQQQHMKLRHRREWATIEENRNRLDRIRNEDFQKQQAEAFSTMAETNRMLATLMMGAGGSQGPVAAPQQTERVVDLKKPPSAMNKTELLSLASSRGVDVDPEWTRDQLYEHLKG
jgi:hypothetical protein